MSVYKFRSDIASKFIVKFQPLISEFVCNPGTSHEIFLIAFREHLSICNLISHRVLRVNVIIVDTQRLYRRETLTLVHVVHIALL